MPTVQASAVGFVSGAPGHSWQNVSCGHTSIGHKGVLTAGKVIAATAIDLFEQPETVKAAKEEFESVVVPAGGYCCLVPPGRGADQAGRTRGIDFAAYCNLKAQRPPLKGLRLSKKRVLRRKRKNRRWR